MAFARRHFPARCFDSGARRSILINSCSKKLGVPGLRIGWLVAHPDLIDLAGKAHDYLLLGLNRQHQHIAARWLADPALDPWLENIGAMLRQRQQAATRQLTAEKGFAWPRAPMGGMFLFPDVRRLYQRLAPARRPAHLSPGAAVAEFLFHQVGVATVPGEIYGAQGADHVRMVLCSSASDFDVALDRLTRAADVAEQA
jgi:aspartate/methionine/tyrosine aminotransferase